MIELELEPPDCTDVLVVEGVELKLELDPRVLTVDWAKLDTEDLVVTGVEADETELDPEVFVVTAVVPLLDRLLDRPLVERLLGDRLDWLEEILEELPDWELERVD